MNKIDMSDKCMSQFDRNPYETMEIERRDGIITEEEFQAWYDENCGNCKWMCEICMCGEK